MAIAMVALICRRRLICARSVPAWPPLLQGLHFVWHRKTVLGAISPDLFCGIVRVAHYGGVVWSGARHGDWRCRHNQSNHLMGARSPPARWRMQTFEH